MRVYPNGFIRIVVADDTEIYVRKDAITMMERTWDNGTRIWLDSEKYTLIESFDSFVERFNSND